MRHCHPPCRHFAHCARAVFVADHRGYLILDLPCEGLADAPARRLPPVYTQTLAWLHQHNAPATSKEIAAGLGIKTSVVSERLSRLKSWGYLADISPTKRQALYQLTDRYPPPEP